jgi:para-aminobenzoate synthetase component 1
MTARPTIPLVRSLSCFDPLELLPALSRLRHPFLLHSSLADERGRWSFFGAEPFETYSGRAYDVAVNRWRALSRRVRAERWAPTLVPFTGGAVGYWAYDFGRRLERWPERARDDLGLPDFVLGLYDVVGAFDHRSREAWLFSTGLPYLEGERQESRAAARLEQFAHALSAREPFEPLAAPRTSLRAVSTFTRDGYRAAVERVQEHIGRGDIYQANLSQRWTLPLDGQPPRALATALHAALAERSPAPFAAYLDAGDHIVVSASPERFLELRSGRVESRPIKGTRPRGASVEEDLRFRAELEQSDKDRAENVMIVDVLRNDLGRVCRPGSVRATRLCELERFPQVFHLTSTIEGMLDGAHDAADLLAACFPGGSITGAPKLRAIELLEQIEPVRRHLYTGAIGYLDWRGDADWNIAIRTALVTPSALHFAAGGGITADSDPDAEYEETLHKSAGIRAALAQALHSAEPAAQEAG